MSTPVTRAASPTPLSLERPAKQRRTEPTAQPPAAAAVMVNPEDTLCANVDVCLKIVAEAPDFATVRTLIKTIVHKASESLTDVQPNDPRVERIFQETLQATGNFNASPQLILSAFNDYCREHPDSFLARACKFKMDKLVEAGIRSALPVSPKEALERAIEEIFHQPLPRLKLREVKDYFRGLEQAHQTWAATALPPMRDTMDILRNVFQDQPTNPQPPITPDEVVNRFTNLCRLIGEHNEHVLYELPPDEFFMHMLSNVISIALALEPQGSPGDYHLLPPELSATLNALLASYRFNEISFHDLYYMLRSVNLPLEAFEQVLNSPQSIHISILDLGMLLYHLENGLPATDHLVTSLINCRNLPIRWLEKTLEIEPPTHLLRITNSLRREELSKDCLRAVLERRRHEFPPELIHSIEELIGSS